MKLINTILILVIIALSSSLYNITNKLSTLEEIVHSIQVRPSDNLTFNIDRVIPMKSPLKTLKIKE